MHKSRGDNVQEILSAIGAMGGGESGGGGGSDESRAGGFFIDKTSWHFVNCLSSDFHQIWPQYVNPCPLENFRKKLSKNTFCLCVICPKNLKIEWVKQALYFDHHTAQVTHCSLDVVRGSATSFLGLFLLYDARFQSYKASNFTIFALLPVFSYKTPLHVSPCFTVFHHSMWGPCGPVWVPRRQRWLGTRVGPMRGPCGSYTGPIWSQCRPNVGRPVKNNWLFSYQSFFSTHGGAFWAFVGGFMTSLNKSNTEDGDHVDFL